MRYRDIAQRLIVAAHDLDVNAALTVSELLVKGGIPGDIDHVLVDDDPKRLRRLDLLTGAIRFELELHETRRMRAPLAESQIAPGSFICCFADHDGLSPEERDLRARLRLLPRLVSILRDLSPDQFERLCGQVLIILGCHMITVTPSQKDDGVDVLAGLSISAAAGLRRPVVNYVTFYRILGGLSFLVYCQAKRYSINNPVRQEVVFEVEGSWRALRNNYFDGILTEPAQRALRELDYRLADPVLLMLMTTSRFTSGAIAKGEALGVILLDGGQIGQLMLEAGIGVRSFPGSIYDTSVEIVLECFTST